MHCKTPKAFAIFLLSAVVFAYLVLLLRHLYVMLLRMHIAVSIIIVLFALSKMAVSC